MKENGRYPWDGAPVYGHVIEFGRAELDLLARAESLDAGPFDRDPADCRRCRPGGSARLAVRLLNSGLARRWELGDDILASYRRTPRPADGQCSGRLDPSGGPRLRGGSSHRTAAHWPSAIPSKTRPSVDDGPPCSAAVTLSGRPSSSRP